MNELVQQFNYGYILIYNDEHFDGSTWDIMNAPYILDAGIKHMYIVLAPKFSD